MLLELALLVIVCIRGFRSCALRDARLSQELIRHCSAESTDMLQDLITPSIHSLCSKDTHSQGLEGFERSRQHTLEKITAYVKSPNEQKKRLEEIRKFLKSLHAAPQELEHPFMSISGLQRLDLCKSIHYVAHNLFLLFLTNFETEHQEKE